VRLSRVRTGMLRRMRRICARVECLESFFLPLIQAYSVLLAQTQSSGVRVRGFSGLLHLHGLGTKQYETTEGE